MREQWRPATLAGALPGLHHGCGNGVCVVALQAVGGSPMEVAEAEIDAFTACASMRDP